MLDIDMFLWFKVNMYEVCKIYNVNWYKYMLLIYVLILFLVVLIKIL